MLAAQPFVSSRILRGFDGFLATKGLESKDLFNRSGLCPLQVADDGWISFPAVVNLFELAAQAARDEAFGLKYAAFNPLGPIGLYHYMASSAPNLREALRVRAEYARAVVLAYTPQFNEDRRGAHYAWPGLAQGQPQRQFINYTVTLLVARARLLLADPTAQPVEVRLQHAKPRDLDPFRQALGARIHFGAAETSVHFDAATLARPLPSADPVLFRELVNLAAECGDEIVATPPQTLSGRVREQIFAALPGAGASPKAVAGTLGVSLRSLQRVLADEGTTFERLLDETRRDVAQALLADSNLSLTEIAYRVGFSELSAFSRIARRWFGEPATLVRRRLQPAQQR
jgi:AraC-like DNA-binding protein